MAPLHFRCRTAVLLVKQRVIPVCAPVHPSACGVFGLRWQLNKHGCVNASRVLLLGGAALCRPSVTHSKSFHTAKMNTMKIPPCALRRRDSAFIHFHLSVNTSSSACPLCIMAQQAMCFSALRCYEASSSHPAFSFTNCCAADF